MLLLCNAMVFDGILLRVLHGSLGTITALV